MLLYEVTASISNSGNEDSPLVVLVLLVGSTSMVGLAFTFIAFSLFSDARDFGGISLMNLLASLFLGELLHIIGVGEPSLLEEYGACLTLTICHQYALLSQYSWLLALVKDVQGQLLTSTSSGVTLLSSRTSSGPGITRSLIVRCSIHWGAPATVVGLMIPLQMDSTNVPGKCWIPGNSTLSLGLGLTAVLIGAVVIVMSAWEAWGCFSAAQQLLLTAAQSDLVKTRLFFALKLLLLLSAVLTLGTTATLTRSEVLWEAFHIGHSLQGVFIAIDLTCNCKLVRSFSIAKISKKRKKSTLGYGTNKTPSAASHMDLLVWKESVETV